MHVCAFEEDTNLSPRTGSVIRESEESLDEHVREMIKAARIRVYCGPAARNLARVIANRPFRAAVGGDPQATEP